MYITNRRSRFQNLGNTDSVFITMRDNPNSFAERNRSLFIGSNGGRRGTKCLADVLLVPQIHWNLLFVTVLADAYCEPNFHELDVKIQNSTEQVVWIYKEKD